MVPAPSSVLPAESRRTRQRCLGPAGHEMPTPALLDVFCAISLMPSRSRWFVLASRTTCLIPAGCIQLVREGEGFSYDLASYQNTLCFVTISMRTPPVRTRGQQEKGKALTGEGANDLGYRNQPGRIWRSRPPTRCPRSKHQSQGQLSPRMLFSRENKQIQAVTADLYLYIHPVMIIISFRRDH